MLGLFFKYSLVLGYCCLALNLSAQLNIDWLRSADIYDLDNNPRQIATNHSGDVYFIGNKARDFDPTYARLVTIPTHPKNWYSNYIAQYDSNGDFKHVYTIFGKSHLNQLIDFCFDASGNMYLLGIASDTTNISLEPNKVQLITPSKSVVYMVKYNARMELVWYDSFVKPNQCTPQLIQVDGNQNVVIAGTFKDTLNFSNTSSSSVLISTESSKVFVAHFSTNLGFNWANLVGANYNTYLKHMIIHKTGGIIIAGQLYASKNGDTVLFGGNTIQLGGGQFGGEITGFYAQISLLNGTPLNLVRTEFSGIGDLSYLTSDNDYVYVVGRYQAQKAPAKVGGYLAKYNLLGREQWRLLTHTPTFGDAHLSKVLYLNSSNRLLVTGNPAYWYTKDSTYSNFNTSTTIIDTSGKPLLASKMIPDVSHLTKDSIDRIYFANKFYNNISVGGLTTKTFPKNYEWMYYSRVVPWCETLEILDPLVDSIYVCDLSLALQPKLVGTGLTYQWYEQGKALEDYFNISPNIVYDGSNGKILTVYVPTAEGTVGVENSKYTLRVQSLCSSNWVETSTNVVLYANPFEKSDKPEIVSADTGKNIMLKTILPLDNYGNNIITSWQWTKGSNFVLFDNSRFSGTKTSSLEIKKVDFSDVGLLYARPINKYCPQKMLNPKTYYLDVENWLHVTDQDLLLHVYPNPVSDFLHFDLPVNEDSGELTILDITGKVVFQKWMKMEGSNSFLLSHLPNGLYNLQLRCGECTYHNKIIIMK